MMCTSIEYHLLACMPLTFYCFYLITKKIRTPTAVIHLGHHPDGLHAFRENLLSFARWDWNRSSTLEKRKNCRKTIGCRPKVHSLWKNILRGHYSCNVGSFLTGTPYLCSCPSTNQRTCGAGSVFNWRRKKEKFLWPFTVDVANWSGDLLMMYWTIASHPFGTLED